MLEKMNAIIRYPTLHLLLFQERSSFSVIVELSDDIVGYVHVPLPWVHHQ